MWRAKLVEKLDDDRIMRRVSRICGALDPEEEKPDRFVSTLGAGIDASFFLGELHSEVLDVCEHRDQRHTFTATCELFDL